MAIERTLKRGLVFLLVAAFRPANFRLPDTRSWLVLVPADHFRFGGFLGRRCSGRLGGVARGASNGLEKHKKDGVDHCPDP